MANQYVNKVIVNNEIKMDLTEDTITPNTLRKGFTAHDASGAPIVGNESLTDISEDGTNAGPILELSAEGWAEQTQLSGKNLLPNTVSGTQTINGVTFTVNPDKSITCTGTATADALFDLATPNTILGELSANASYCCYGVPKGYDDNCRLYIRTTTNINNLTGGSSSILQNGLANVMMVSDIEYINRVYIKITSGTTVDIVISPQLELGTMPTSYEPYCGGMPSPNPEYPQEIKVARGRNLLNPSLLNSTYYSANADGSVMVVDTDSRIWSSIQEIPLSAGSYVLSRRVGYGRMALRTSDDGYASETVVAQGVNTIAFTLASDGGIKLKSGYSYSSVTVTYPFTEYIQLEKGSVATPYIPYGHVGMEVQGRNMLPNKTTSQTINGITFTPNADGSVTVNGTSTAVATYYFMGMGLNDILKHGETYTISGSSDHAFVRVWSRTLATKQDTSFVWDANVDNCNCVCTVNSGVTISNEIVYPQLEAGSEATEYEPYYHSTIPIPLPSKGFAAALPDDTSDILSLNGAGGYEWTNSTNEKVLDSSVGPWNVHSSIASWFYKDYLISDMDYAKGDDIGNGTSLSSSYIQWSYNTVGDIPNGYFAFGHVATDNNVLRFVFKNTDFTVKEDFTSWIAQNPVTVLYPLATPTIEQGYVNEWNNDFPLGCTIDIPELRNINVEYFLYDSITQLADDYYDRTTNDISEAMSQTADSATLEALAAIAPIENDISSANYAVGSYLINDGKLYQVTQAIAANEAITVGTNVVLTDVGSELDELNDAVDEINANPYILPTMSESEKGGAKIGEGLSVSNDILNVDMLGNDPNDAGPLLSLQAEGWAEQTQLSGKNLLPHHMSTPTTVNGITYVENADRSITFDGTASNQSRYYFANTAHDGSTTIANLLKSDTLTASIDTPMPTGTRLEFAFYKDTTWTGKVVSISGSNSTLTITAPDVDFNKVTVYILVENSIVVSNTTIHPQLELGTQATSYEPYCGGIPSPNPDYPQDIRVARGRNLIHALEFGSYNVSTGAIVNDTNLIRNKGHIKVSPDTTYTFTGYNATIRIFWYTSSNTLISTSLVNPTNGAITFISPSNAAYLDLQANTRGVMLPLQLEEGSTATLYVPYGHVGMEVRSPNLFTQLVRGITQSSGISYNDTPYLVTNVIPVKYGDTYEISHNSTLDALRYGVNLYDEDLVRVNDSGWIQKSYSIHKIEYPTARFMCIIFGQVENARVNVENFSNIVINRLDTIPIPLPQKGFVAALPDGTSDILRLDGAGGYEWELNTNEVVLDGSSDETWSKRVDVDGGTDFLAKSIDGSHDNNLSIGVSKAGGYAAYASHFIRGNGNIADLAVGKFFIGSSALSSGTNYMLIRVSTMTLTELQTWLAQNPITVLYPLATPTIEKGYLPDWDNCIPIHATLDIPDLRNLGVECYLNEESARINSQWSKRLKAADDISASNGVTESLASLAPVEGDISSANYTTGSYLVYYNQLYKVTSPIASGENISIGSNITPVTLSDDVKYLIDHPYILPTMSESTKGGAKVGYGLNVENDILSVGGVDDPNDAGPIVKLNANGWAEQLSTSGKNLLDPNDCDVYTRNGVTATKNTDGSVTFAGTTDGTWYGYVRNKISPNVFRPENGTYTFLVKGTIPPNVTVGAITRNSANANISNPLVNGGGTDLSVTFEVTDEVANVVLYISTSLSGVAINTTVAFQLELGSQVTSYEPYTGGAPSPSPSYPQEIKVCRGRNLYDAATYPLIQGYWLNAGTGSNPTDPEYATTVEYIPCSHLAGKTITLNKRPSGTHPGFAFYDSSKTYLSGIENLGAAANTPWTIEIPSNAVYMRFCVMATAQDIQLELGSTAHPYVPYDHIGVEVVKLDTPVGEQQKNESSGTINNTITTVGNSRYWFYAPIFKVEAGVPITLYGRLESSHSDACVSLAIREKNSATDTNHRTILTTTGDVIGSTDICLTVTPTTDYIGVYVYSNGTTNAYTYAEPNVSTFTGGFCTTIPIPLPSRGWVGALPDGTADTLTLDGAGGYEWTLPIGKITEQDEWSYISSQSNSTRSRFNISRAAIKSNPDDHAISGMVMSNMLREEAWTTTFVPGDIGISKTNPSNTIGIALEPSLTSIESMREAYPNLVVLYPLATPQTESGYIDYDNTIPVHATISSADLEGIEIRCVADSGAAEISAAWGKRIENELSSLCEIVNTLLDNS